jgi:hypothetical protein
MENKKNYQQTQIEHNYFHFQVWLEELEFEELKFGQFLHSPHLPKRKGGLPILNKRNKTVRLDTRSKEQQNHGHNKEVPEQRGRTKGAQLVKQEEQSNRSNKRSNRSKKRSAVN